MRDPSPVLSAFREDLIAADLVRRPSEAGPRPPMHVSPINGAPAPGEREGVEDDKDLVLSLLYSGRVAAPSNYEAASLSRFVFDVRFRSRTNEARRRAMALEAAITTRLIRPATNYGFGFQLGSLWVVEVAAEGGGPIASSLGTGFDDVAKYVVEVAG